MMLGAGAVLALVAVVGVACGGDDDGDAADSPTVEVVADGANSGDDLPGYEVSDPNEVAGGDSISLIADLRLTFEGEELRLADLQDGAAIDRSEMSELGAGASDDVEAADMTVYRRAGDADGVWLFVEAHGEGDQAVPATWYRFSVDGGGGAACGSEDVIC
jgi:hypothetical protein